MYCICANLFKDMHGRPASGARCLNCVMSVYLDPFFVCTSSEDSGQCAHVCAHMHTVARVFTARTNKERVYMCASKCAHMCTLAFFVCKSSEYSGQCANA